MSYMICAICGDEILGGCSSPKFSHNFYCEYCCVDPILHWKLQLDRIETMQIQPLNESFPEPQGIEIDQYQSLPEHVTDAIRYSLGLGNGTFKSTCTHEYKQYQGLTEVYQYCVKCDKKI